MCVCVCVCVCVRVRVCVRVCVCSDYIYWTQVHYMGSKDNEEDEWIPEHSNRFRWRIKGIARHRLVNAKNHKKVYEYRVQWVGYGSSHDQWIR